MSRWQRIARESVGSDYAARYAERFRSMAERGDDVHGEASFVSVRRPPPARVLDAGCGTGRVGIRLHELGYDVVGVDLDPSMLLQAREDAPGLDWRLGDLSRLDTGETYDVVLVAGNTIPLLEPGTLTTAAERLAAHLVPVGVLVCGFGLDPSHLPGNCPVTPLADVDAAFEAAGLVPEQRFSTWDRAPYADGGYIVTVHTLGGRADTATTLTRC